MLQRLLVLIVLALAGCSTQTVINRIASADEQAFAIRTANLLRSGRTAELQHLATPELAGQQVPYITRISPALARVPGPFSVRTVNSFKLAGKPVVKRYGLKAGAGQNWAIVRLVIEGDAGSQRLAGWDVVRLTADPAELNRFRLGERGLRGLLWIGAMIASAMTCIWATVLIWRREWLKRRWLWTIGSLLGFGSAILNWQTGASLVLLLNVQLLGASALKANSDEPWLLSFGVPIIAIFVIVRWYRQKEPEMNASAHDAG